MLTHAQVWSAIDRLAAAPGCRPRGWPRRAGLDPTTFNKSKRITAEGRAALAVDRIDRQGARRHRNAGRRSSSI